MTLNSTRKPELRVAATPSSPPPRLSFSNHSLRSLILAAALACGWPVLGTAENKVLFIGNSFTQGSGDASDHATASGGVPGIFDRLAQAGGQVDPTTVMRAVGGTDFQFHSGDATTRSTITSQPWTHVILQNYSIEPTHYVDGTHSLADHYTYGTDLYLRVMTNNALTQVILYETWSRAAAHPLITGVSSPTSFESTTQFQTELRTNYQGLADSLNAGYPTNPPVTVAPVGDAWENVGGLRAAADPQFVDLFSSDNYHGNDNGYYLAACVFYSKIYGVSPNGLSTNSAITSLNLNLTVPATVLEDAAWNTVSGAAQGQTFLVDFGAAASATEFAASPDDPVNHWNNVTEVIGGSDAGQLLNLVTTSNSPSSISLVMLSRFNGANLNGTTASPLFASDATSDSLFGNTETFGGLSNVFPGFKLTGLDPAGVYSFTFFASRTGVVDNRETGYTVSGSNSGYAALNAAENTTGTALVAGITPDGAGEITVSLAPTTNNTSPNHFTYLGVMKMEAAPPQQPIVFTLQPASQNIVEFQPVTFSAAVQGSPPFFVQWLSNGVPVPGANQFSYTIPSITTNMSGDQFSVIVSNLAYSATSSNAVLTVTPAPPASTQAQTFLFDFGGANTVGFGPSPDDPVNYWNNVTTDVGGTPSGQLTGLVTSKNTPTSLVLAMLSRFNGANENGTLAFAGLPQDATRDSLFGNTELFGGLANVFPSFKITGLSPAGRYNFTFYASRTGVGDNRETGYTVQGANSGFAALNVANNISSSVSVNNIQPGVSGEITVNIGPTANNNNANHFTYLGMMKIVVVPAFLPPTLAAGQITLQWIGDGQLEWAGSVLGPWTPISPAPASPYSEAIVGGQSRFYRLNAVQ